MKIRPSVLAGVLLIAAAASVGCSSDDPGNPAAQSGASTDAPDTTGMGVPVTGTGATVTVNSAYETATVEIYTDGSWAAGDRRPTKQLTARDGGTFVVVGTTVVNDTRSDMDLTCRSTGGFVDAVLQTDPEAVYQPIRDLYELPGNPECNAALGSGFSDEMTWVFEIPADRTPVSFNFTTDQADHSDPDTVVTVALDRFGSRPPSASTSPKPTTGAEGPAVGSAEEPAADVPAEVPVVVTPGATVPTPESTPDPPAPVVGFTGAPGVDSPHVLDKEIASCGDPSIHETGTTFFTDGTSGWTSACAALMG